MLAWRHILRGRSPVVTSPGLRARRPSQRTPHHTRRGVSRRPHSSSSSTQQWVKFILVGLAWGWIALFFGVVFYNQHGSVSEYNNGRTTTTTIQQREDDAATNEFVQQLEQNIVDIDMQQEQPFELSPHGSPLLLFTCNRAEYLKQSLSNILKYIPSDCTMGCPVVVSQDGRDPDVSKVIADYQGQFVERKGIPLIHMQHKSALRRGGGVKNSYQALAIHYGWALRQVFDGHAVSDATARLPQRVVILEEDLQIANDFFGYMAAMAPFLESDESLLAVSAFNDNGFADTVSDPNRVLRSDFFPGLGWMLTRKLWTNELQLKWPSGYWDDWLRDPQQRQNRQVVRPEISRTFHFGVKGGASKNQFGKLLNHVHLNDQRVDWEKPSVPETSHWAHYLQSAETFQNYYWKLVNAADLATNMEHALESVEETDARLEYQDYEDFQKLIKQLKQPLMDDEKAGILRTAYKGIVETRPLGKHILFFTPRMEELQKAFSPTAVVTKDGETQTR